MANPDEVVEEIVEEPQVEEEVVVNEVIDEGKEEEWMREGDEPSQGGEETVPLHSHIKAKRKLKGKISELDEEVERLKNENAQLKSQKAEPIEFPKRPRRGDFEFDDDYEDAMDVYEEKKDNLKFQQLQRTQSLEESQKRIKDRIEKGVDEHYARAESLLESSGITPDAFKASDQKIREAVESIRPKQGDGIVDQFISRLGEGSEKVMFRLGRSKALLGEFIGLLANDPSGLDAATFLGEQKAILLNTGKRKSGAPVPDTQLNGDETAGQKEKILKKRYQEAHKKGNGQEAWNAKRQAKAAGVNTSGW